MWDKNKLHLIDDRPISFNEYLTLNPHLYDHVSGLTDTEKAFINEEFWDLMVNPTTFSHHFLHQIDKYIDRYLELKELNLNDKLKDIVTNERVRMIVGNATSSLTRNATRNGTSTGSKTDSTTINQNNKSANRALPMNSSGEDLDDIVDWSKGASDAGETQTRGTNSTTGSESLTTQDVQTLTDLNSSGNTGTIRDTEMNELAVDCIGRIWDYIVSHDALEWLCKQLESCFILVL